MEEMTTTEVRDAIGAGKTTVLIFNGSTEASGPALAIGKHVYLARYLGERIASKLGNALVAPVVPFAPPTTSAPERLTFLGSHMDNVRGPWSGGWGR